jgi:transcription elongation factor GreA
MADYITKEGMTRLKKRMQRLVEMRRVVIKNVVTAREMGDLSENAEYKAAREEQRYIENEFNHLKNRLSVLQVLDISQIPKDAVRFGARVTLLNLDNDEITKVQLVGTDEVFETDDEYERRSIVSPVGKQLIGKKTNTKISVEAPIGVKNYKILEIK